MKKMWTIGIRPMMMVTLALCTLGATAQETLKLTLDKAIEILQVIDIEMPEDDDTQRK